MKTTFIVLAILLACVSCEQAIRTPSQIEAEFGQEFMLSENQSAILSAEGLQVNVRIAEIQDTRCPASRDRGEACVMYGSARVRISSEDMLADLCTGDCRFGIEPGRYQVFDTANVQVRGRYFQVHLLDVTPHPREYVRTEKKRPTLSVKLLIKEL